MESDDLVIRGKVEGKGEFFDAKLLPLQATKLPVTALQTFTNILTAPKVTSHLLHGPATPFPLFIHWSFKSCFMFLNYSLLLSSLPYWMFAFPMSPPVSLFVGWLVCCVVRRSVILS